MTIQFSDQQLAACVAVKAWLDNPADRPVFRLFGYAGTGKTTIARYLADNMKGDVCYAAFTGKAALMMRRNGCVGASTIHSLIYSVIENHDGSVDFRLNPDSIAKDASVIVIDECSMVDADLGRDLLSFGKPILVLGDPAQLPPVSSAGFFTEGHAPDVMLTEIHRQAAENPIIRLATQVRQGEPLEMGEYGQTRIVPRGVLTPAEIVDADQVIVGRNATRHGYNGRIRRFLGRPTQLPERGDKLVCLRNNKTLGIFNGGLFTVRQSLARTSARNMVRLRLLSEDFPDKAAIQVKVREEFFTGGVDDLSWKELRNTEQFDYGYALTCHKAQGSQWGHVVVYDESAVFREDAQRWLYTAITRAAERLTLVV